MNALVCLLSTGLKHRLEYTFILIFYLLFPFLKSAWFHSMALDDRRKDFQLQCKDATRRWETQDLRAKKIEVEDIWQVKRIKDTEEDNRFHHGKCEVTSSFLFTQWASWRSGQSVHQSYCCEKNNNDNYVTRSNTTYELLATCPWELVNQYYYYYCYHYYIEVWLE